MSKRAEEAALKAYPKEIRDKNGIVIDIGHPQWIRDYYIEGYEQAEKDLALTVEDVLLLIHIWTELPDLQFKTLEAIAEETLKRFNEQKNGL